MTATLSSLTAIVAAALLLIAPSVIAQSANPFPPRLVLQITVDQLRGDLPGRYLDRMGDGGFRYLFDKGVVFANAHHAHANTETIVGSTRPETPSWYSGAEFRRELAEVRSTYPRVSNRPDFKRMVLIGHSMGGLVSSLQIREGGDDLWYQFFEVSVDEVAVDTVTREQLRKAVYFTPNKDVTRVVFVATPHRGSKLAQKPIVKWISKLIEAPFEILSLSRPELVEETTALGRTMLDQGLNGVSGLRLRNPRLEAILGAPIGNRVTYHSIIGNRGKDHQPLEETSDGVVPYVSSHLDGAATEKIVPSNHFAHRHPEAIAEIRRILLEHLK